MNREQRRAQERHEAKTSRARRLAALGSGAVLAASAGGVAVTLASQSATAAVSDTVTNLNDSGAGSLRDAITDANTNGGGTITIDPSLSGSIVLGSRLPDINENVTLTGAASGAVTIDADGSGAFYVNSGGTLTISNLTVTGAGVTAIGVSNGGAIVADNMRVVNNDNGDMQFGAPRGGGFSCTAGKAESSTLTITNSVVSGNTSVDGGGAVYAEWCDVTIVNTTIADNSAINGTDGGGLYLREGGNVVIENSTISGNYAEDNSGGAYIWGSELVVTISNSTFAGNSATNTSGENLDPATAISVRGGATLTMIQSTVSGNHHAGAPVELYGALYLQGELEVGSAQNGQGGNESAQAAVRASGDVQASAAGATVTLIGTIVSGNGDPANPNSFDLVTEAGPASLDSDHSLLGDATDSMTVVDLGGTIRSTTPGLGALANNGGATQTMALQAGSVAIDAGPSPVPSFPLDENDQRGAGFPRVVNGKVDIGAFEVQPAQPIDILPKFTG